MTKLNVHEAKTHLSKYLKRVADGETVILCKNGEPIAQIVPLPRKKGERLLGCGRGLGSIPPGFFEPLTEDELPGMGLG